MSQRTGNVVPKGYANTSAADLPDFSLSAVLESGPQPGTPEPVRQTVGPATATAGSTSGGSVLAPVLVGAALLLAVGLAFRSKVRR